MQYPYQCELNVASPPPPNDIIIENNFTYIISISFIVNNNKLFDDIFHFVDFVKNPIFPCPEILSENIDGVKCHHNK